MHFEKLEPSSDFYHLYLQQILDLQDQNLFENLSPDARKKGCLLSSFSADDFRDMSENICVAIALDPPPLCPLASLSVLSLPPGERRDLSDQLTNPRK